LTEFIRLQRGENPCRAHGIPHRQRVGQQTEPGGLIHDLFVIPSLKRRLIGKREAASELVSPLPEKAFFTGGSNVHFFERLSNVGDILAKGSR
jgi:hypothetical protein